MGGVLGYLKSLFYSKKLEIVLVGLENSGKTTFANLLALGPNTIEEPPTVGLNVKIFKKQNVTCKLWDIGGQAKYRSEWPRYTKGCSVIAFMVDTTDLDKIPIARKELHQLLEDRELNKVPLLILANKIDLGPKIEEKELITSLNLDYISENPWLVIPVSARVGTNVDKALEFLIKQADSAAGS